MVLSFYCAHEASATKLVTPITDAQ